MCVVVAICLLVVGIVLLSYGGINATYKTKRIQLAQPQLPISTDPTAYSAFLASPTIGYHLQEPQSTSFYVFNVTNAGEVVQGALPLVQQVGPYVYTQTSEKLGVAVSTAAAAATVSYRVHTSYQFDALRSNGSESDVITNVNVTYARTLAKLAAAGFSERTLAASFAHTQLTSFEAFFRGPFLAQTKQRALGSYLQSMDTSVRQAALPAALTAFRAQVASQTLPQHATHLFSHVRQARVPGMLSSLYDSFLVQYIPATLTGQYDSLSRLSLPRVLSNVVSRMTVEVTPSVTLRRERQLRQEATPALLSTMLPRVLENIALPYIVQEYMEQACFEAVPSMLNTIKNELVQAAVAQRILPTEAHQNTLLLWMQSESPSTSWTNVDALVGGAPTGVPRVGFELNSIPVASNSTVSRTLSLEVAALLFHEKANVEFSLLTYDRADTTRGFGLWKQAVALNADAIARLLAGVNNEVATPSDYLTLAQILGIRDYILYWSQSSIVRRDRQRYWAMAYTARTTNSLPEPDVDLDWETVGVQPGFSLVAVGGTDVGLSDATVEKLWDGTTSPSFLSPQGYILWSQAMASDTAAKTSIATTFGLSSPQLTSILDWLTGVVISATFKRHVVRHWAQGGTSPSPFNNVTDVQWFDLEPAIGLAQGGFELPYDATLSWPDTLAETLWDSTQPQAFVSTAGFNTWKTILVTPTGLSDMTTALNGLGHGTVTERHVRQVSTWLQQWIDNKLFVQAIHQWWRDPATYPWFLPNQAPFALNRPALSAAATEALWDASSDISILHVVGYSKWMTMQNSSSSLLSSWNAQIVATCANLTGGANSAVFATGLAGSCGLATLPDVAAVQLYVQHMAQDPYVKAALLAQWRCGTTDIWDVEPYRDGLQGGWELCRNRTTCGLASANNTVCAVPTTAFQVWDPSAAASLVNPITFQNVWLPLLVVASSSSTTITASAAQAAVATAFGQPQWLPWMEVVSQWVASWVSNEVLMWDVLGLWMQATCDGGAAVGAPITTSVVTTDAACEPGLVDSTNETVYTSSMVGGRPTTYFTPDFNLLSASDVGTTTTIQRTQSVITCDSGMRTTTSTMQMYTTTTCLMADTDPAMPGLQRGFELNAVTTTLTIDVVQNLWTPSKPYSFLNPVALDVYWSKAADSPAKLAALLQLVHVDAPNVSADDLNAINLWLKAWRHNDLMSLFVLRGWLAPTNATIETFDLDPRTPAVDTGFELRWVPAMMAATSYPTLSQAQYLWDDGNEFSFLTANTDNANVGFGAWVQAYSGAVPSSERLTAEYPPVAHVTRQTQTANVTIVGNIQAATGLTASQIQAIATWLLMWPDHAFLWQDVLSQWRTQTTQFTDTPARWNVATLDTSNGGSTSLSGFELPVPMPPAVSISPSQARQLWDVYTPYSFLNPKMLVVWCFASSPSPPLACPHLTDVTGSATAESAQSLLLATLSMFQTTVYAATSFVGASSSPVDRARNFLSTVSGLSTPSIVAVATWLTRLPTASTAYQYLMLRQWQQPSLPLDPRYVGFEVSFVYNTTAAAIPRNVTPASMVANVACAPLSTDLARRVWESSDPLLSFTNAGGIAAWLAPTLTMPGLLACQVTQIQQWLTSWQAHPFLRQLVEYRWFSSCSTVSPCANLTQSLFDPQRGFEVTLGPSANVTTWQTVAQVVWDRDSPLSFLHPSGFKVWRTLLTSCTTSNLADATCAAAVNAQALPTALSFLVSSILPLVRNGKLSDVQDAVYTIGYVWLLRLLDTGDFSSYLLRRVGRGATTVRSLATQQWINATVFNFTNVASLADVVTTDTWNATSQSVLSVPLPQMAGPPELRTYCDRRKDNTAPCGLGDRYTIDDAAASATLSLFTDPTKVSVGGLTVARGVVVLDLYLAQPFTTADECAAHAAVLASLFTRPITNTTSNSTTNNTSQCWPVSNAFGLNTFPLLAVPSTQLTDMQMYLRHVATTFGYARPAALPLGSYLTQQSVRSLLWANPATATTTSSSSFATPTSTLPLPNIQFPATDSLAQRTPLVANVTGNQSTTITSLGLSSSKYGCVIAQVASPTNGISGGGIEYQDPTCSYTDGSVFPPGAPSSLSFFWSFGRQILNLTFSSTTTRFGVALRRYTWRPTVWLRTSATLYDDLPVTVTSPHLYNLTSPAVPFAAGLSPDAQAHATVVDVEPLTGLVLHSRMNWQVNVQIGPTAEWFPNLTSAFVPVFWTRHERSAAPSAFESYGDLTDAGPFAAEKVAIWELVGGVLCVGLGVHLFRRMHLTRQRSVRLIQPNLVDDESSATVDSLLHATAIADDDAKRQ